VTGDKATRIKAIEAARLAYENAKRALAVTSTAQLPELASLVSRRKVKLDNMLKEVTQ